MAAAPNILEAAPVTPASPAPTPTTAGTGFDAVLVLQTLAAAGETLATGALEAADTADLLATDESDDEDDAGEDLEASLAFLSALLTATAPPASSPSSGLDFADSRNSGGAEPDASAAPKVLPGDAQAFMAGESPDKKSTDPLLLTPVRAELLETRQPTADAAQALARAADLLAPAARPVTATTAEVVTHARDPRWADDFSARVSLLVRAGESTASLQLTPVDLGPVEVSVTVKDSQATIHFGATQADTRALIEASLPRLRELLASQGFNLLDASVSSGFSRSQQQPSFSSGARGTGELEPAASETAAVRLQGLLDTYA